MVKGKSICVCLVCVCGVYVCGMCVVFFLCVCKRERERGDVNQLNEYADHPSDEPTVLKKISNTVDCQLSEKDQQHARG